MGIRDVSLKTRSWSAGRSIPFFGGFDLGLVVPGLCLGVPGLGLDS